MKEQILSKGGQVEGSRASLPTKGSETEEGLLGKLLAFPLNTLPILPPDAPIPRAKLRINTPGDRFEREADRMAEQVAGPIQRKCTACREAEDEETVQRKAQGTNTAPGKLVSSSAVHPGLPGGKALEPASRSFMEGRFGADFSQVRIHADERAARLSEGLGARAFTYGSHIFFNRHQYAPHTRDGRKLLAHELTHVLQQGQGGTPDIQRDATDDPRLDDPNFLICLALCYIGLPPNLWRRMTSGALRALNEEYRERYGEEEGAERFGEFAAAYTSWSWFNRAKFVINFVGEGRLGVITIRAARATAIRNSILRVLERAGIRTATVVAASQIIRKVALVLELVWAAGCFAYCTAEQMAVLIRDMTIALIEATATVFRALSTVAGAISEAIGSAIRHAIYMARAKTDITNWDLAPELPGRARGHLQIIA